MKDNLIQWPRAKYWEKCFNPIIGCRKISPACEHCYAEAFVKRFNMTGCECNGFEPTRKQTGKKMPQKGVVFCGNITDLFGSWVTPEEQDNWFEQMNLELKDGLNKAIYLWLTKRPGNMARAIHDSYEWIGVGAWFGFTAENQEMYDIRFKQMFYNKLLKASDYWLSVEPLLEPIDLGLDKYEPEYTPFSWVVVGCESGPHRRPCKIEWVENIVNQCKHNKVPVFVKQLDIGGKCVNDITKFPKDLQIRQIPWEITK